MRNALETGHRQGAHAPALNRRQHRRRGPVGPGPGVFALQKAIRDISPKKPKLTVFGNLKRRLFTEIGA